MKEKSIVTETGHSVKVVFPEPASGWIGVYNGKLLRPKEFQEERQVEIEFTEVKVKVGSFATVVTIHRTDGERGFSFFIRDVTSANPIWVRAFSAAVVPSGDSRDYLEIVRDIKSLGLESDFDHMNRLPEESSAHAFSQIPAPHPCPVWLGLGRDPRLFQVGPRYLNPGQPEDHHYWGTVMPLDHQTPWAFTDSPDKFYEVIFTIGPGSHCDPRLSRRLLDGWMPILTSVQDERSIRYDVTAFTSNETGPVTEDTIAGVDPETAYTLGMGRILPREEWKRILSEWRSDDNPVTVCAIRVKASNPGKVPAYAWFKAPEVKDCRNGFREGLSFAEEIPEQFIAASRINGIPMPDPEMAVLVPPGGICIFDMWIPHRPIAENRASRLLAADWNAHFAAARRHWQRLADSAVTYHIPEPAISERAEAGLAHLEILLTGPADDNSPLLANAGIYTPIGTESSPIIQYFDSVGMHDKARRSIEYFFDYHQKPDGYIQCYSDYQSETGPVLWTAGEHFRYTNDEEWLRKMTPRFKLSCEFLLEWRNRNKTEELRRCGCYGLASGKVADPEDFFHSFFLNAGNFAGLLRMAEVLRHSDPEYAEYLAIEVEEYRLDILVAIDTAIENAPVVPSGDGSWTPAIPGWPEHHGATILYADGGKWHTHGDFAGRDTMTGPLWLGIAGAIPWDSFEMDMLLQYNQHPQTIHNAGISQPYYSRHDIAHLARGEVKLFLQTFYNQMAGLQDREAYTFWEHYYFVSVHKTHEEAWFLMQLRWMLWFEPDTATLRLFAGAPRMWFAPGGNPGVENAGSYFGSLDFRVEAEQDRLVCNWRVEREPERIEIRLPHPEACKALRSSSGVYDPEREIVTVTGLSGTVTLEFA